MKDPKESPNWSEEYQHFMQGEEIYPPQHVYESVRNLVHRDLCPSYSTIFAKISLLHITVGSLSLLLCSQFGMGKGLTLVHYFMRWGDLVCMMACGSLFLGLTTGVAGMILSQTELRRIRQTGYSMIAVLGLASLLVFLSFGAEIAVNYALAWLFGALLTGVIGTELSLGIKGKSGWKRAF